MKQGTETRNYTFRYFQDSAIVPCTIRYDYRNKDESKAYVSFDFPNMQIEGDILKELSVYRTTRTVRGRNREIVKKNARHVARMLCLDLLMSYESGEKIVFGKDI